MAVQYGRLATKLQLLSRPRLGVDHTDGGVQVMLLPMEGKEGDPLATYTFALKENVGASDPNVIMALSEFLETAALMLDRRSKGKHPTIFAQDLYNHGFWANPANGSDVLECEITHIDYDLTHWDQ